MADLARPQGRCSMPSFQHVDNPPPTPVADHADAFVEWTAEHLLHAVNLYTAYPDVTAKEIKALAAAADVRAPANNALSWSSCPSNQLLPSSRSNCSCARGGAGRRKTWKRRHASLCPVRAAWGTTRLVSLRSMTAPSTIHCRLHQEHRTGLRSDLQIHQEPATLAMQKTPPGVH